MITRRDGLKTGPTRRWRPTLRPLILSLSKDERSGHALVGLQRAAIRLKPDPTYESVGHAFQGVPNGKKRTARDRTITVRLKADTTIKNPL
jgi:hypothetical protein